MNRSVVLLLLLAMDVVAYLRRDDQHRCTLPKPVQPAVNCAADQQLKQRLWYYDRAHSACLALGLTLCRNNLLSILSILQGNAFRTWLACNTCKPLDDTNCSGNEHPLTQPGSFAPVFCGDDSYYMGESIDCPQGYVCRMGAHFGVCCNAAIEAMYEANKDPVCPNGEEVEHQSMGVMDVPILGLACKDDFCRDSYKCVQNTLFAYCCKKYKRG